MSHKITKEELQDRLTAAQQQVAGLQEELGTQANRAAALEQELIAGVPKASYDLAILEARELAAEISGVSNMVAFAYAMASAIECYQGPNPQLPAQLAHSVCEELEEFIDEYRDGHFDYDRIVAGSCADDYEDQNEDDRFLNVGDVADVDVDDDTDFGRYLNFFDNLEIEDFEKVCTNPNCSCK